MTRRRPSPRPRPADLSGREPGRSFGTLVARLIIAGGFAGAAWFLSSSAAHAATAPDDPPPKTTIISLDTALSPLRGAASQLVGQVFAPETTVVTPAADEPTATSDFPAGNGGILALLPSTPGSVGKGSVGSRPMDVAPGSPASTQPITYATSAYGQAEGEPAASQAAGAEPSGPGLVGSAGADLTETARADLIEAVGVLPVNAVRTDSVSAVFSGLAFGGLQRVSQTLDPVLAPVEGTVRPLLSGLTDRLAPMSQVVGRVLDSTIHPSKRSRVVGFVSPMGVRRMLMSVPAPAVSATALARPEWHTHPAYAGHDDSSLRPVDGRSQDVPEPSRVPVYPGSGLAGATTTASGSHLNGGTAATITPDAAHLVASAHLPRPDDVDVRRLNAEAPTFSPD